MAIVNSLVEKMSSGANVVRANVVVAKYSTPELEGHFGKTENCLFVRQPELFGRHDTRHNDIQHNDNQYNCNDVQRVSQFS